MARKGKNRVAASRRSLTRGRMVKSTTRPSIMEHFGSRAVPADSADLGYDVLSQPQLRKLAMAVSLLLAVGL